MSTNNSPTYRILKLTKMHFKWTKSCSPRVMNTPCPEFPPRVTCNELWTQFPGNICLRQYSEDCSIRPQLSGVTTGISMAATNRKKRSVVKIVRTCIFVRFFLLRICYIHGQNDSNIQAEMILIFRSKWFNIQVKMIFIAWKPYSELSLTRLYNATLIC